MGSFAGAPNMITGKTEPIDDMNYDDWLMWAVIQYGINNPLNEIKAPLSKIRAAVSIGHLLAEELVEPSGFTQRYAFTKKAQRYLDMINKEGTSDVL